MADAAYGVILKKGTTSSGGSYSDWGLELTNVPPPGFSRTAIDTSHHGSAWATVIMSGLKRMKPFTVEVNWDISETNTIKTEMEAADMVYWKVEFGDGSSSLIFRAGISDFTPGGLDPDGKATASIEFTPSGEGIWA